jgi:hypothetical protein
MQVLLIFLLLSGFAFTQSDNSSPILASELEVLGKHLEKDIEIESIKRASLSLCLDEQYLGCAPSIKYMGTRIVIDEYSLPTKMKREAIELYKKEQSMDFSLADIKGVRIKEFGHMPNPMEEQNVFKIVKKYKDAMISSCHERDIKCVERIRFKDDLLVSQTVPIDLTKVDTKMRALIKEVNGMHFFHSIVTGYTTRNPNLQDDSKIFVALSITLTEKAEANAKERIMNAKRRRGKDIEQKSGDKGEVSKDSQSIQKNQ